MQQQKVNIFWGFFLFSFFFFSSSNAQLWWADEGLEPVQGKSEFNIVGGANNFLGDLGGTQGIGKDGLKDFTLKTIRPLLGISLSYNWQHWMAVKGGINITTVAGADSLIKNNGGEERWRYYRNLSFRSSIIEAFVGADLYPLLMLNSEKEITALAPFVGIGIGAFHFNPQAQLNGSYVDLQPLRLEGQGFTEYPDRKPYKLTQLYIPISFGVKYYMNNQMAISLGAQFRKTFTDYIDDISTTYIDPNLFDSYLTADQALIAKQLYSRSLTPGKVKPDIEKADVTDKDSYVTFFFSLSFRLAGQQRIYYGGR